MPHASKEFESSTGLDYPKSFNFLQVSRPLATPSLTRSLRDLNEAHFARLTRKTQGKLISIEEVDLE